MVNMIMIVLIFLKNYYNFAVTTNKSLFNKKKHGLLEMPRVSIGRNTSMFKFFKNINYL